MTEANIAPFELDDVFERLPPHLAGAAHNGILYVEDFDAPSPVGLIGAAMPPPDAAEENFTRQEYNAACAQAHEAGMHSGLDQARVEQAALQAQLRGAALASIGDALAAGGGEREAAAQRMGEDLAHTIMAVLLAALPATCAQNARGEIAALLRILLPNLRRQPSLLVQVHPDLLDSISADLDQFRDNHTGTLTIMAHTALAASDVLVRWSDGEARRDTGALWEELRQALAPFALPSLAELLARESDTMSPGQQELVAERQ